MSSTSVVQFQVHGTSTNLEHPSLRSVSVTETAPRRWLMLPVVLLAMFMAGFDLWVVNVAAPSLQRDLHVTDASLELIVGGYAFMDASGMVTRGGPGGPRGC